MRIEIRIEPPRVRGGGSRRRVLFVAAAVVALLAVAVPAAWAAGLFGDTSTSAFEPDIEAIALAGITKGCSTGTPPNYCPTANVTREAMAAFMHRGFGRVALGNLASNMDFTHGSGGHSAIWSYQITAGPPAGALAGATGFIKVDAMTSVANSSGATVCVTNLHLKLDGQVVNPDPTAAALRPGDLDTISATGVGAVTDPGPHTVTVELDPGAAGCSGNPGVLQADGESTATYIPFGSGGSNTLSAATEKNAPVRNWPDLTAGK